MKNIKFVTVYLSWGRQKIGQWRILSIQYQPYYKALLPNLGIGSMGDLFHLSFIAYIYVITCKSIYK